MPNDQLEPLDMAYLKSLESTLSEWSSPEDSAAFDDLEISPDTNPQA